MLFWEESKQLMYQRKCDVETNIYSSLEIFFALYEIKSILHKEYLSNSISTINKLFETSKLRSIVEKQSELTQNSFSLLCE